MSSAIRFFAAMAAALLLTRPAFAYIGPGAGLSVVAAFWALLTAVVSSILFLVLWPLRQRFRRRRSDNDDTRRDAAGYARMRPDADTGTDNQTR